MLDNIIVEIAVFHYTGFTKRKNIFPSVSRLGMLLYTFSPFLITSQHPFFSVTAISESADVLGHQSDLNIASQSGIDINVEGETGEPRLEDIAGEEEE